MFSLSSMRLVEGSTKIRDFGVAMVGSMLYEKADNTTEDTIVMTNHINQF